MAGTVSERLLARLRELPGLELPEGARLKRVAASRSDAHRDNGSWSWCVVDGQDIPMNRNAVGSHWPMWVLLKFGAVVSERDILDTTGDICIDPPQERQYEALTELRLRRERRN